MNELDSKLDHELNDSAAREGARSYIQMLQDIRDWQDIANDPEMLIQILSNYELTKGEEKGDISGIFKTCSLNARYFKPIV